MTGPEHYREAESMLDFVSKLEYGTETGREALATAQVHATLALAAATALNDATAGLPSLDWSAWGEIARTNRHGGDRS